jgi:hypothetical protein
MTEPRVNGTALEKIAWLDEHVKTSKVRKRDDGRFEIILFWPIKVVLAADGGWWIEN